MNWSESNTTYGVSAGYYTGGTLDSRPSYNNGYNSGWNNGVSAADNRANPGCANWNAGRSQGQSDVTGNPNAYGLYTKSQYDSNWNNGYNSGASAKVNNLSCTLATNSSTDSGSGSTAYHTVNAWTGFHYVIISVVSRANSSANKQGHSLSTSNGSIGLFGQMIQNSSTTVTVWHLSKSDQGSAATISVTANRTNVSSFLYAISLT